MENELKIGYSYLIKRIDGIGHIYKIICIDSTNTCYKIKSEKSDPYYIEKQKFNCDYKIIENLGLTFKYTF